MPFLSWVTREMLIESFFLKWVWGVYGFIGFIGFIGGGAFCHPERRKTSYVKKWLI